MSLISIFPTDGIQTQFQYGFTLLSRKSALVVKLVTGDVVQTLVETTDYTHDLLTKTVTTVETYATGSYLRLERSTSLDRHIDYTKGSVMTETNFDEDPNRLTAVTQELAEGLANALQLNASGTGWDAENIQITNLADGVNADDAATVGQVYAIAQGQLPANINDAYVFDYTGDGTETMFPLPGLRGLTRERIEVFVNNVPQSPVQSDDVYDVLNEGDDDYPDPAGGPDYLVFSDAPLDESRIIVRLLQGTVGLTIPDNTIDGDMIGDGAIGADHLNVGAGAAGRILIFDADGDAIAATPAHTDISDFDAGVRANRLNEMAAPTASVAMGGMNITGLATALTSETTNAVNVACLLAALNARIQVKCSSNANEGLPTVTTGSGSDNNITGAIGFAPDLFIITARFLAGASADLDRHATYIVMFTGASADASEARIIDLGQTVDGKNIPRLKFYRTVNGNQVRAKLLDEGDLTAWTQEGWVAIKFGTT